MAKRSRSRSSSKARRVTSSNANRRLPSLSNSPRQLDLEAYLNEIDDRRTFHPAGPARNAVSFHSSTHTLVIPPTTQHPTRSVDVPAGVAFQAPHDVLICVRRKQRKEVLHATKKAGKSGQKRPRRNYYSEILC